MFVPNSQPCLKGDNLRFLQIPNVFRDVDVSCQFLPYVLLGSIVQHHHRLLERPLLSRSHMMSEK